MRALLLPLLLLHTALGPMCMSCSGSQSTAAAHANELTSQAKSVPETMPNGDLQSAHQLSLNQQQALKHTATHDAVLQQQQQQQQRLRHAGAAPAAQHAQQLQPTTAARASWQARHILQSREGIPTDSPPVTLAWQLKQAAQLKLQLTNQELQYATALISDSGAVRRSTVPDRAEPGGFPDGYVAICAVVKDQHRDLREWLEYHAWIGVQKIYICDNNSTVPLAGDIAEFVHSGLVEYEYFAGAPRHGHLFRTSSQWRAYNDCLTRFRHRHRWMAFIDADEFIVLHNHTATGGSSSSSGSASITGSSGSGSGSATGSTGSSSSSTAPDINSFMKQYDKYGGLALNWVIFGSSGHKQRPAGGALVNYQQCLPLDQEQNTHVKVVANTQHVLTVGDDPHQVYYRGTEHFTVNELGEKVTGPKTKAASHTKIALYHYLTKSEEEYTQKMTRGSGAGNHKSPEFFTAINHLATATCTHGAELGLHCCASVKEELGSERQQRVQAALSRSAAGGGAAGGGAASAAAQQ